MPFLNLIFVVGRAKGKSLWCCGFDESSSLFSEKKAQNNRWQRYEIKVFQQIGLKIEAKIVLKQGNYATFVKIINALAEAVERFRLFANVKSEL